MNGSCAVCPRHRASYPLALMSVDVRNGDLLCPIHFMQRSQAPLAGAGAAASLTHEAEDKKAVETDEAATEQVEAPPETESVSTAVVEAAPVEVPSARTPRRGAPTTIHPSPP